MTIGQEEQGKNPKGTHELKAVEKEKLYIALSRGPFKREVGFVL